MAGKQTKLENVTLITLGIEQVMHKDVAGWCSVVIEVNTMFNFTLTLHITYNLHTKIQFHIHQSHEQYCNMEEQNHT